MDQKSDVTGIFIAVIMILDVGAFFFFTPE